jgi:hypothetical protein
MSLPVTMEIGYAIQNGTKIHIRKHIASGIKYYLDDNGYFYTYSQFDREYWPISPEEAVRPINEWREEHAIRAMV